MLLQRIGSGLPAERICGQANYPCVTRLGPEPESKRAARKYGPLCRNTRPSARAPSAQKPKVSCLRPTSLPWRVASRPEGLRRRGYLAASAARPPSPPRPAAPSATAALWAAALGAVLTPPGKPRAAVVRALMMTAIAGLRTEDALATA